MVKRIMLNWEKFHCLSTITWGQQGGSYIEPKSLSCPGGGQGKRLTWKGYGPA